MGGNDPDRNSDADQGMQHDTSGNAQRAEAGGHENAEIEQSAQRQGMGQRRARGRNTNDIDADDTRDLGNRDGAAAKT